MQNIDEAYRMLDAFASVGARHFDVTFLDIDGAKRGFRREQSVLQLRNSLPKLLPGLTERQNSLVVRPQADGVTLVQLDDLDSAALKRLESIAFLTLATSLGNHQAWVALSGAPDKDLARRLRKGTGADLSASGASRLGGTVNYKRKSAQSFPTVAIVDARPGRIVTPEQLEQLGLLAEPEPVKLIHAPRRVSPPLDRPWPSYEITLSRTRPRRDGSGPDRSLADFNFAMTCFTGGKTIEDTIARLMEVSPNAQERAARGDEGYARITVENAAAAVARNWGRNRS